MVVLVNTVPEYLCARAVSIDVAYGRVVAFMRQCAKARSPAAELSADDDYGCSRRPPQGGRSTVLVPPIE